MSDNTKEHVYPPIPNEPLTMNDPEPIQTNPPSSPTLNDPVAATTPNTPSASSTEVPVAAPVPQDFITTMSSPKTSNFKTFVIISLLVIAVIYSAVAYLYFQNKKAKDELALSNASPTSAPAAIEKTISIIIKNGNVVKEVTDEGDTVLVAKSDYPTTGITGFAKVTLSNDKTKMCLESLPPAPGPGIYVANADGTNVVKAGDAKQNCTWDSTGGRVFYSNSASTIASVNIYQFDLATATETDLTGPSIAKNSIRQYKAVGLSADSSKLMCQYEDLKPTPKPSEMPSGQCEIDLTTKEVKLL
jgi:hypothetical protein